MRRRRLNVPAFAALAALAIAAPVQAKTPDCAGGYMNFLGKISPYIERVDAADLPEFMRRALSAYDSCMAGDSFSPYGVWEQIATSMEKKSKR